MDPGYGGPTLMRITVIIMVEPQADKCAAAMPC